MQLSSAWNHTPYLPLTRDHEKNAPLILRLAPFSTGFSLEWQDAGTGPFQITCKAKDLPTVTVETREKSARIEGLAKNTTYTVTVSRDSLSNVPRLVETGDYPDTVVHYLHPEDEAVAFSGRSLCSPSLVMLPSGRLLCSMDVFVSKGPQNLTHIFQSDDGGKSWTYLTDLFPCFWGKLFTHNNKLYMLGHASEYGALMIGASEDEGKTWSAPVSLLPGSGNYQAHGPHKAPMPVLSHGNRLWTAVDYGCWFLGGHANSLLSIDENADLLCAENWHMTKLCHYDKNWRGAIPEGEKGCIEGNAVVGPDGTLYNMLRYATGPYPPAYGKAVLLRADGENPDNALVFDRIVPFNGAQSKFVVQKDAETGLYFSISNLSVDSGRLGARYTLALQASADLEHWHVLKILIDARHKDAGKVGFQYPDFVFDGADILYASRTAINTTRNFHDANCTTVGRVQNFRALAEDVFPGK